MAAQPEAATPAGPQKPAASATGLDVIALVSGGKDSFYALAHCIANGHRVVALANLYPAPPAESSAARTTASTSTSTSASTSISTVVIAPESSDHGGRTSRSGHSTPGRVDPVERDDDDDDVADLNSFMYQTVGHELLPLYATATGIPLYRRAIAGSAAQRGRDYSYSAGAHPPYADQDDAAAAAVAAASPDETESMLPLLRTVLAAHPSASALSAGAVLSTYQRTRVESVALRLGLAPLAYLWQWPALPGGGGAALLRDMGAAGLDARLAKVASGGLDAGWLWARVTARETVGRLERAMGRFGAREAGAVLGEGGEFETLVVDGPGGLFRKRIVVDEERGLRTVSEGGGTAWLRIDARAARLESKAGGEGGGVSSVRIPALLHARFEAVRQDLEQSYSRLVKEDGVDDDEPSTSYGDPRKTLDGAQQAALIPTDNSWAALLVHWVFTAGLEHRTNIQAEAQDAVDQIRCTLRAARRTPLSILSAIIVLREMSAFPAINKAYGALFSQPNPPSRVTIASGAALPDKSCNLAIYLTLHPDLADGDTRQGLHVQSRSYWAPANIGPYSQAIAVPVASLLSPRHRTSTASAADLAGDGGGQPASPVKLVAVAGQIPLVPATMELPPQGPDSGPDHSLALQLALSLQHLWRIGHERGVQWWTSAVAYFPASAPNQQPGGHAMAQKSQLAGRAWSTTHRWAASEDAADDENGDSNGGPDLWDRMFNAQYRMLGGGSGGEADEQGGPPLPDWSVLADGRRAASPPCFAAEVHELPRAAGVEWHAHGGLSDVAPKSVQVWTAGYTVGREPGALQSDGRAPLEGWRLGLHCTSLACGEGAALVHTVVTLRTSSSGTASELLAPSPRVAADDVVLELQRALGLALSNHGAAGTPGETRTHTAMDGVGSSEPATTINASNEFAGLSVLCLNTTVVAADGSVVGGRQALPMIPCFSLWDARGEAIAALAIYQHIIMPSAA